MFYESHGWAGWWDPKDISPSQTSNLVQTEEVNHKEAANKRLYQNNTDSIFDKSYQQKKIVVIS